MTWRVPVRVHARAELLYVDLEPLPSGLPQALVVVRAPRPQATRQRWLRLFERPVRDPASGRRVWVPTATPRYVTWRVAEVGRSQWWVAGPFARVSSFFGEVLDAVGGKRLASRIRRRDLILIDPCTGAELAEARIAPPRVHAPDAGDDATEAA